MCSTPAALAQDAGPESTDDQPGESATPSQSDIEAAKELFRSAEKHKADGQTHADDGDKDRAQAAYGRAARDYLQAYKLSRLPDLLYNLAQIYRMRGELNWALRTYRKYIELAPQGRGVERATQFIQELENELGQSGEPAPGDPSLDPSDVLGDKTAERGQTQPGPGDDSTANEPKKKQASDTGIARLVPDAGPRDASSGSSTPRGWRIAAWTGIGLTAASAIGVVITWRSTKAATDDAEDAANKLSTELQRMLNIDNICTGIDDLASSDAAFGQLQSKCDDGKRHERNNKLFWAAAGVGVAASGALLYMAYVHDHSSRAAGSAESSAATAEIAPVIGPGTMGARVLWRF
ncbi:MAG: hypothetical protein MJE77_28540 [Proteobacteria bacterium]|nr:hypothetical protein [Pseudomonadota bacterium]